MESALKRHVDNRRSAILGVSLALGWPLASIRAGHNLTNAGDDLRTICVEWAVVLGLAAVAFWTQGRRPSWLGIKMSGWRDVLAMVAALAGTFVLGGVVHQFVAMPADWVDTRALSAVSLPLRIALVLTAGMAEEFMYRGFAIEELGELLGNRRIAALVSWGCFTIAHGGRYGFSPALLLPGAAGATLTILYLWRHNLPVCMSMHIIIDGVGIILVPALMATHGR
jgi:membrane protease YdiL (CAAX protease family)